MRHGAIGPFSGRESLLLDTYSLKASTSSQFSESLRTKKGPPSSVDEPSKSWPASRDSDTTAVDTGASSKMQTSDILNKITKAKRSQGALVNYTIAQDQLVGNKVKYCGTWLHMREWVETGETRLMNANFCKKFLLCQGCAVRRAAKMHEAYLAKVEHVSDTVPGLIPAMVTLTVKNGKDLEERYEHLKSAWTKMITAARKARSDSGRHSPVEWNKVCGSIRSCEVTISKTREWHPHLHAFVLISDYIDQAKLVEEWENWTGDSKVVDVRKCHGGIKAGLVEVLKYSTKFSSLSPAETYHVHEVLSGKRLIDPQGDLRGVKTGPLESDDISGLTGEYRDFIAEWLWTEMKFRLDYTHDSRIPLAIERPNRKGSIEPTGRKQ